MNEEQKRKYWERYLKLKHEGVKFFPDVVYKDAIVAFLIFLLLVGLAAFLGVHPEPRVDPNDTAYIPRPEWYFLFLFQFLKAVPPQLEWVGATVVPGLAILILFLLPFIDKNPYRHWSRRKIATGTMTAVVLAMVVLTIQAVRTTPPQPEKPVAQSIPQQIATGHKLFESNCAVCHGKNGEGVLVKKALSSKDVMYTHDNETLANIISFGQPEEGMQPFGTANGGSLSPDEIKAIVTFMRYTWDDRVQPPGATPTPAP